MPIIEFASFPASDALTSNPNLLTELWKDRKIDGQTRYVLERAMAKHA